MTKILALIIILFYICDANAQWQSDILGNGYQMKYIYHPDDYSGTVRSTIIKKTIPQGKNNKGVLYIHGYNDYFFKKN